MIAVDSSVLIDLLSGDRMADAAEAALRNALGRGRVAVCDVVVAEVCSSLGQGDDVPKVLEEMGITYVPVSERAAVLAGEMQRKYRERGGRRQRSVPDFIVGAHAMLQCTALITRDAGFFRDYFKGLKVLVPAGA